MERNKDYCTLSKAGIITIPSKIRKHLNIKEGDMVKLKFSSKQIVVELTETGCVENVGVISGKGSLYIPKEIRRLLNLQGRAILNISVNPHLKGLMIEKEFINEI
jgi:AbrB family looped-hinge helix DNA binding protein